MITKLKNVIDTGLTVEEMETLAQANEILHKLQKDLGNKLEMMSLETGEIISTDEFLRVRGILNGLATHRGWQLSIKEWVD